jgi:hypothetical protein
MLFVGADKPRCNIDTPTASRLNVRDDREAPLQRGETGDRQSYFLIKRKKNFVCQRPIDGIA